MSKIVLSWLATRNDFENGGISDDSPNYNLHKFNYEFDEHYLLISSKSEFLDKAELLYKSIKHDFPQHKIKIIDLEIEDPINTFLIKNKILDLIVKEKNFTQEQLTAYISPGTPAMQVAWYLLKMSSLPKLTLLQGRKAAHSKTKKPTFEIIDTLEGDISYSLVAKETKAGISEKYPVNYKSIKGVYEDALKIANAPLVSTLILGSTGTGKENLARYIHCNSPEKEKPFLAINCSAFSDNLLESRLFGYVKGAFTGANIDKKGLFEEAEGGTVFLDEIGDISSYMQQALLRVIQEKEIMYVGSSKSKKINFRVVAATNKNLLELCKEGKFRWDLYYRISTATLKLPDLVEWRTEDKKELINYMLFEKSKLFNKSQIILTEKAFMQLTEYSFPGNIRELENIIENLYVFNSGIVNSIPQIHLLSKDLGNQTLAQIEKDHIKYMLKEYDYNLTRTAEALGIVINTLKSKMKIYDLKKFLS